MTFDIKEKIEAVSVPENATIRQTMQIIDKTGMGMALLVEPDTKRFVGLVTDGDIRRALLKGYGLESAVWDVLRPETKTLPAGSSAGEIAEHLSDTIHTIPLLNDAGQVVDLAIFDRRIHLPVAEPSLSEKELQNVVECIVTGWVSSAGKFVTKFEELFADFCGTKYALTTSSGTSALHLALRAFDIGPGDDVIVPTLTFIATANAVTYTGAQPVFVDSEPETWDIDPHKIEESISSRTKAIIPVHLYGHPADMEPILEIADKYGLAVIEDAAEAHGGLYKGRRVGSIGQIGIFSFYGNKIITTGEGGMITTNRSDLAEKICMLRDHGMSKDQHYWHPVLGYNYRMTNLQAAVGVAQMEKIDDILSAKQRIHQTYNEGLGKIPGICLPPNEPWARSVCWLYSILINPDEFGYTRDDLMAKLKEQDIETRPFFPPLHIQPIYKTGQPLPVAENLSANGLSLPSARGLKPEDINRVTEAVAKIQAGRNPQKP